MPTTSLLRLRAATQPSPSNLKDRIAALQQSNGSPSPTPSPTSPPRDASITPPRGSLRDKIAKFERKGGVPIPRGSFGMSVPPPEEAGSTKSRELYGNRVAALGKGRPTAPGNFGHRAVTSPAIHSVSPSSRTSPDRYPAKSAAHSTPNSISSASSSTSPSLGNSSEPTDRPDGPIDAADGSVEAQEISVQPAVEPQVESSTVAQDAKPLEPSNSSTQPTISTNYPPPAASILSSPTSLAATTLTRGNISPTPLKATSSNGTPTEAGGVATSIIYENSPTSSESHTQERSPAATPKSTVSTVQAHISVEKVPVKEATTNVNPRAPRLDRSSQNGSLAISSTGSDAPSVTRLPTSSIVPSADSGSTSITSDTPIPDKIKSSNSTSASTVVFPSPISSTVPPVSVTGDLDDPVTMSPPPVAEPGRRSFSAVVHRGDSDNHSESRHSTTSRSSTVTPRISTSSFKTGTDGGVVRSKRNFKHLGAVAAHPPPSPGPGDLSTGELAALLQDAAWLEQQLSGETTTLTVPSALGEEWQKVEMSESAKAAEATTRAPTAATSTRTKGRGLTLGSSTSKPSSDIPQLTMRSSPPTPSFQVHPDASPTAPKSSRGRKYFSLRTALRGPRLSLSSEMSSDDSALVATPPSPSFDLAIQQPAQGHGNDTMSIRSMFSMRSNKSGKSESAPGSLRLSPRRGVARASSFAERLLNRATKTKSMLDDPGELPLF
jgi:hypothetical protein